MMERSQLPHGQHDALTWFTESQLRVVIRNGVVPEWFHGIISRKTSEELLMSKPRGYFLIRVSESRIGYTLSYCAEDRCRHFMISALEDGHYIILGEKRRHRSLHDLVDFHRRTPIVPFSQVLTVACGQTSNDQTDYAELLFPQRHPNPNTSRLPNNSLHPSVSHPTSGEEDIPPTLPYRPNGLMDSAVLSSDKLYPSFEEDFPHVTSSLPPMPATRKRYTADNPPSDQPPEIPARSSGPPLKQDQVPESPSSLTATENPLGTNIQSVKNQEAKPSVASNLKNLRKKFQKKKSLSQECTYAEVNVVYPRRGNAENEYQNTFNAQPFSYARTDVRVTDGGLPHEYLPPPPFAPGFCYATAPLEK
ncbi:hematopoietic SH2 domain-containing protein homolog [Sebastes fasciatus]|uniref:hematopoietic SH2 domain-containing protein homolog n=1 Tax=Sebastes fasciatus TaxID=394691 RepID=UPI003D9DBE4E